jgi:hypothetical protein
MAEKSGRNKSIEELTAEIGQSGTCRARFARPEYTSGFPGEIPQIISPTNGFWLSAAAAVGRSSHWRRCERKIYVNAKSGRKSQKKLVESGVALAVLKIVANLARPAIVEFVKTRLTDFGGRSRRKT